MSIDSLPGAPERRSPCLVRRPLLLCTLTALGLFPLLTACEGQRTPAPGAEPAAVEATNPARERVVLFVGTSLTAGYGLDEDQAFPARLQEKIDSAGLSYRVINAGVSGETSAGALRRLDWLMRQPFDVIVLETGANDMLRGQDPDSTRANVEAMLDRIERDRPDARVVLAGMLALPNLGADYREAFESIFPELARERGLPLVPFLLEEVAADPELNLADGIHPNEAGQRQVAETVWQVLEPVLHDGVASAATAGPGA